MKAAFNITVLAVLLVAPSPCFALWVIAPVSKELAKELGMEVRSTAAGPNQVRVELEFKTEGKLERFIPGGKFEDYSGVKLRMGEGKNPLVTAPLREDRSKPGRVVVSFTADRAQLEKLKLWVYVPESDGGTICVLAVKDFVELKKEADELPKATRVFEGVKTTFPAKSIPEGVKALSGALESCHHTSDGTIRNTADDLKKAQKGDHVRFVFPKPFKVGILGENLEVSEAVFAGGGFWLVCGKEGVVYCSKYEHEKMTRFEEWYRQVLPAD